jgi:hypothetical protein
MEGEVQCNQKNQKGEKCNVIRRIKRERSATQSEESKGRETIKLKKPRGGEAIQSIKTIKGGRNQFVSTQLTKQPNCEHSTHQTTKL